MFLIIPLRSSLQFGCPYPFRRRLLLEGSTWGWRWDMHESNSETSVVRCLLSTMPKKISIIFLLISTFFSRIAVHVDVILLCFGLHGFCELCELGYIGWRWHSVRKAREWCLVCLGWSDPCLCSDDRSYIPFHSFSKSDMPWTNSVACVVYLR